MSDKLLKRIPFVLSIAALLYGLLWTTDVETFELVVSRITSMPWVILPVTARLIITLMLGLPLIILINKPILTKVISALLFLFATSALFVQIDFPGTKAFIDESSIFLSYAFSNIVLIFISLILLYIFIYIKKSQTTIKRWIPLVVLAIPLVTPYFLAPVFIDELTTLYDSEETRFDTVVKNVDPLHIHLEPQHVYMFVSPTCIHCRRAMKKMALATENSPHINQSDVTAVVPVDLLPEQFAALSVLQEYEIVELEDTDFIKITSGRFPMIVYTDENAKPVYIWNGRTFNYRALSFISSK